MTPRPEARLRSTAATSPTDDSATSSSGATSAAAIALFAVLVRVAVSIGPYSGQGNGPMYGDYEAQRHWMEITLHTPASEWYRNTTRNDLSYWGLDYPPLTAYQSLFHAALFLNRSAPDALALGASRGYESPHSKLLMRWTVLSSDLLVFFPAVAWFLRAYRPRGGDYDDDEGNWLLLLVLLNPCLILIDHGHFQYNCISLGLTVGATAAILSGYDVIGSVLFSLALNHKQMSAYFAPAFLGYLLGKCFWRRHPLLEVSKLGFVVLGTFSVIWLPYLHSLEETMQVLSRLAPFERGLYEDYVANFWCSSSVIIKWKKLFSMQSLKPLTSFATILCFLPSFIQQIRAPSIRGFLYSLLNCSFAFYLFSYQVHEKSILLPLLPASLLALEEPFVFGWLVHFGLLSMFPLLCRDNLILQYVALFALFVLIYYPLGGRALSINVSVKMKALVFLALLCSITLHFIYLNFKPPKRYPYFFEALMMIVCFSQFVVLAVYTNIKQWMLSSAEKMVKKKV